MTLHLFILFTSLKVLNLFFYISSAHFTVLWFIFCCFMLLKVYQMRSFSLYFLAGYCSYKRKLLILIFISYVMTFTEPSSIPILFSVDSHRFLKKIFSKNSDFFFSPFSNRQGHTSFLFWFSLLASTSRTK